MRHLDRDRTVPLRLKPAAVTSPRPKGLRVAHQTRFGLAVRRMLSSRLCSADIVPTLLPGGRAMCMPADDAVACGFDRMSAADLESMLVHADPRAAGTEPTGYRVYTRP